ncbi:MAG: type II secretion system protein GspD [Armatimonadota bacterium]
MTLLKRQTKAFIVACIAATLIVGFSIPAVGAEDAPADDDRPINIDVRDMQIGDVLRMLGKAADANIIVGKNVTGEIGSLTLRDVSVEVALRAIATANGYHWRKDGNIYFVTEEPTDLSDDDAVEASESEGERAVEDVEGQPPLDDEGDIPAPPADDDADADTDSPAPSEPEQPRLIFEMMPLSYKSAPEVAAMFGGSQAKSPSAIGLHSSDGVRRGGQGSSSAFGSMDVRRNRLGGSGLPQFEGEDIEGGGLGGGIGTTGTAGTTGAGTTGATGTGGTITLPGEMEPPVAIMSHNALLVRGTREEIDEFREMLNMLDIPQKQVEIATKWIDVQTTASEALGIDWAVTNGAWEVFNLGFAPAEAANNGVRYGRTRWWAELGALVNNNQATVINEPRVVCMNGMPGTIAFETEIPYFSASINFNQFGQRTVDYESDSVTVSNELFVVPQINPDDSVKMLLAPQLEDQVGTVEGPNGERIPIVTSQYVETMVRVADGETVVLGGVIRADESVNVRKTPLLHEIPIIGKLFQSQRVEKTNSELLIFVTPRIVRDTSETL